MKRFFLYLFLAVAAHCLAQDSLEVSVLTCEPGDAAYELYGHTAIRVKELREGGRDAVFNYGVFDFETPGFVWRFVMGETDYEVAAIPYYYIEQEYLRRGRRVWQQTLCLDSVQKAELSMLLWENCLPENKRYRYNYLYNNCTTRCRDMIEKVVDVRWPDAGKKTYREIIHEFSGMPYDSWNALGPDILLGWAVDTLIGTREQMFSPIYFMRALDNAATSAGELTNGIQLIINPSSPGYVDSVESWPVFVSPDDSPFSPIAAFLIWTAAGVLLWYPYKKCTSWWKRWGRIIWYALTLLIVLAVAVIIDIMYFFSSHPAVDTNYLVYVFNPLALLLSVLPLFRDKITKHKNCTLG